VPFLSTEAATRSPSTVSEISPIFFGHPPLFPNLHPCFMMIPVPPFGWEKSIAFSRQTNQQAPHSQHVSLSEISGPEGVQKPARETAVCKIDSPETTTTAIGKALHRRSWLFKKTMLTLSKLTGGHCGKANRKSPGKSRGCW
jgi:hypothetical protein